MKIEGNFKRDDVLVYVANDYDNDIGPVCDELKRMGVVVLPVYLGKKVSDEINDEFLI